MARIGALKNRLLSLCMLAISVSPALSGAAEGFPGLRTLMSEEDFSAAGLDGLTPEQLRVLDTWLGGYTAAAAAASAATAAAPTPASPDVLPDEIRSRLSEDFSGWEGRTVFRLENGQLWRQRLSGRYRYSGPPAPEVVISRNMLGYYQLKLVEAGRSVGVSPVQ